MAERGADGLPEVGAVAVAEVAAFRLLARLGECDEVLDILTLTGRQKVIAVTTTDDGSALKWIAYSPSPLLIRSPVQAPGEVPIRRLPMGVPGLSVNWMCTPPDAGSLFDPSPEEVLALKADAMATEQHLTRVGLSEDRITLLGLAAGPMVEVVPCPGGMQVAPVGGPQPVAPPPPALLPVGAPAAAVAPAAPAGARALGFPGDGGIGRDQMSLDDMRASIRAIRRDLKQNDRDSRKKKKKDDLSRSPKKDKKKKDKKALREKKKKKHRKGSGSSGSSSSSTTTSRSSSSSSSSSSTVSGRYVRWRPNGPNRKIKFEELSRFATRKFRDQSEVVAFAASHPGALSGFFFSVSCYRRAHQGLMTKTRDLRHQSVVTWVANHSGLTETRDRREALTLAMAMDAINSKQLAYAMDVLSQRIQSIQAAKTKNGSWEKSQRIELAVEPGAIASSSGMLRLMA